MKSCSGLGRPGLLMGFNYCDAHWTWWWCVFSTLIHIRVTTCPRGQGNQSSTRVLPEFYQSSTRVLPEFYQSTLSVSVTPHCTVNNVAMQQPCLEVGSQLQLQTRTLSEKCHRNWIWRNALVRDRSSTGWTRVLQGVERRGGSRMWASVCVHLCLYRGRLMEHLHSWERRRQRETQS